jgi:hypothetical protein
VDRPGVPTIIKKTAQDRSHEREIGDDPTQGGRTMTLIREIKETVPMEIRSLSEEEGYLEGVVTRKDLGSLQKVLTTHLGPAAKEAGKEASFPREVQNLVDALGGLRLEQSFFFVREKQGIRFAALWPWQSDPQRTTLKCGMKAV